MQSLHITSSLVILLPCRLVAMVFIIIIFIILIIIIVSHGSVGGGLKHHRHSGKIRGVHQIQGALSFLGDQRRVRAGLEEVPCHVVVSQATSGVERCPCICVSAVEVGAEPV